MLSFGTFTQQAVAISVRHVENLSTTIGASSTVNRALSYRAEDSTPSHVQLAQPEGPFATAFVELGRSFLKRGKFGGTSLLYEHVARISTNLEISRHRIIWCSVEWNRNIAQTLGCSWAVSYKRLQMVILPDHGDMLYSGGCLLTACPSRSSSKPR